LQDGKRYLTSEGNVVEVKFVEGVTPPIYFSNPRSGDIYVRDGRAIEDDNPINLMLEVVDEETEDVITDEDIARLNRLYEILISNSLILNLGDLKDLIEKLTRIKNKQQ